MQVQLLIHLLGDSLEDSRKIIHRGIIASIDRSNGIVSIKLKDFVECLDLPGRWHTPPLVLGMNVKLLMDED